MPINHTKYRYVVVICFPRLLATRMRGRQVQTPAIPILNRLEDSAKRGGAGDPDKDEQVIKTGDHPCLKTYHKKHLKPKFPKTIKKLFFHLKKKKLQIN